MTTATSIAMTALLTLAAAVPAGATQAETAPMPVGIIGEATGEGPHPAVAESLAGFRSHTVYRPLRRAADPMPLVVWGNGGCRDNGLAYSGFLREIASHGYFVIAVGQARHERPLEHRGGASENQPAAPAPSPPPVPTPDETQASQLIEAIDWATRAKGDASGPFEGWIDPSRVAVMGHSCGGLQAIAVAADPRVTTSIIFNSGVYNRRGTGRSGIQVDKAALARLNGPVAYFTGGPTDIAHENALDDFGRIDHVPAFVGWLPVGHGGTFWSDPNGGEWATVATQWLDWRLKGDHEAARNFAGPDCRLCADSRWTVVRSEHD